MLQFFTLGARISGAINAAVYATLQTGGSKESPEHPSESIMAHGRADRSSARYNLEQSIQTYLKKAAKH